MVVPKKQDFWPRINILKGIFVLSPSMNYDSSKSAKIVLSKSIFSPFFAISIFAIIEEITSSLGNNDFDEADKPERRERHLWVLFMVPTLET